MVSHAHPGVDRNGYVSVGRGVKKADRDEQPFERTARMAKPLRGQSR